MRQNTVFSEEANNEKNLRNYQLYRNKKTLVFLNDSANKTSRSAIHVWMKTNLTGVF